MLVPAALIGIVTALLVAWQLLSPFAISADTSIFMAMGQGILNGLTPYVDLFETKSPAIFLLSAMSLRLFGSAIFGNILGAIIVAIFPLLIGLLGWMRTKNRTIAVWNFLLALCIILSILLATRPWQTEFFGAGFALLAMAAMTIQRTSVIATMIKITLTASCFLGAFYFKEPFIFSCIAGGLILVRDRKSIVLDLIVPLALACVGWFFIMTVTGYLDAYIHSFLPLIGETRRSAMTQPFWARGLYIGRSMMLVVVNMPVTVLLLTLLSLVVLRFRKSSLPYLSHWLFCSLLVGLSSLGLGISSYEQPIHHYNILPTIILFIIGACQIQCTGTQKKWYLPLQFLLWTSIFFFLLLYGVHVFGINSRILLVSIMLSFTGLSICAFLFHLLAGRTEIALLAVTFVTSSAGLYMFAQWYQFSELPRYISISLSLLTIIGVISGIELCIRYMKQVNIRQEASYSFRIFLALYLSILSIAFATDFQGKHAALAAPFLFALLLQLLTSAHTNINENVVHAPRGPLLTGILCLAVIITGFQFMIPNFTANNAMGIEIEHAKQAAKTLDTVLDNCHIPRYFFLNFESMPLYAYTKHSPLNFFLYATMSRLNNWGNTLQKITWDRFRSADILIVTEISVKHPDFDPGVWEFVQKEFSRDPWACAKGINTAGAYVIYFKKGK